MGKIIIILVLLLAYNNSSAQTWKTISHSQFGTTDQFASLPTAVHEFFKINPFDNAIWASNDFKITTIKNNGAYTRFTTANEPLFNDIGAGGFGDFAFTTNNLYLTKANLGLFRFNNNSWSIILTDYSPLSISSDLDTAWLMGNASPFFSIYEGSLTENPYPNFARSAHKNGIFWGSPGFDDGISSFKNGLAKLYNPDTCLLLDWSNYDFKFSKKTDSLYVAGELGLSIAHNESFIDSITPQSSFNMPSSSIVEFEFDKNDNIWALFTNYVSSSNFQITNVAYYEQSTRTWSHIFDSSNSPMDYTQRFTIEVDTNNNLWVAQNEYLYVYQMGELPAWVGVEEHMDDSFFTIAPNPSNKEVTISIKQQNQPFLLKLLTVSGEEVLQQEIEIGTKEISLSIENLEKGVYFVQLVDENDKISIKKWVKY